MLRWLGQRPGTSHACVVKLQHRKDACAPPRNCPSNHASDYTLVMVDAGNWHTLCIIMVIHCQTQNNVPISDTDNAEHIKYSCICM